MLEDQVDAAWAVAAEFEFEAVGRQGEARRRNVEERERLSVAAIEAGMLPSREQRGEEVTVYIS